MLFPTIVTFCSLLPSPPTGFLGNPVRRLVLVLVVPPTERTSSLDHVTGTPRHPGLVEGLVDVRVRADDVELPLGHLLDPVLAHLTRQPRAAGLLTQRLFIRHRTLVPAESGKRPPGHEQVDRHSGVVDRRRLRPQVVGELLRDGLDGRLGRVVGRVRGRVGDALLGTREDDGRRARSLLDHGEERGQAVDDAEEVDPKRLVEVVGVRPRLGRADGHAGVEHEEVDGREFLRQVRFHLGPGR